MGILDVGITGLRTAQLGLQTTSHNISNSSTLGYNRQEIKQTTNTPNLTGYGYFGQGAVVTTVRRVYNEYLGTQILGAESNVSELDTYLAQAQQIDNLLADPSAGLSPALSTFFQATQQMAADPSSVPARQSMLSTSQALVARFQSLDQRLGEIRSGVNTQIVNEVTTINAYANQLAELNDRIVRAIAISQGNSPNDLLDQRDQLIRDLNQDIRVTTVQQNDGSVNIFIGNGQPLVVGTLKYQLSAGGVSNEDPEQISITLQAPNGASIEIPESQFQGGALGGLLDFRSETLDGAQNSLGKIATAIALNFNSQHRLGVDLDGKFGLDYFSAPQPLVLANAANTGRAVLSAKIIQSDYTLDTDGVGNWTLRRLSGDVFSPGDAVKNFTTGDFPLSIDGLVISAKSTSSASAGDSFLIRPSLQESQRIVADADNTGAAVISSSASNIQSLPAIASDYRLSVTTGKAVQLVRLTDNKSWFANSFADLRDQLAEDPQGFVLNVDDTNKFAIGDTYLIEPTRQAARNMVVNLVDPLKIAAAAPFRTQAALTNEGTGKIDLGSVLARRSDGVPLPGIGVPLTSKVDVEVAYNADGTFNLEIKDKNGVLITTVNNLKAGQPNPINLSGLLFTMSGVPADGDVFTLEANKNGVSDNRNAIALGALQSANMLNGGKATFAGGYGQIVSFVGNKTREVEVTGKAQQALADQAENSRQELSGVNLDEEAANLMRYQQAYQASAKVMEVAGKIFADLLALGG